jgi:quercetin dioxygenase-like cupin family protein
VPVIREYNDEAERQCRLSKPAFNALAEAGLFRMFTPKPLGGLEVDPLTCARVIEEISRVDSAARHLRPPGQSTSSVPATPSPGNLNRKHLARMLASICQTMITAIGASSLPWEERYNEKLGVALYRKNLFTDPETGIEIRLVRYPAGVINPRHTHPCAHGMYVLEGTLVTHEGRFRAGSFVWFPEGEAMEHGASAEQDVVVLFITNKPFEIQYV